MFTYLLQNKSVALASLIIGLLFFGFVGMSLAQTPREQDMERLAWIMDHRETLAPAIQEDKELSLEQDILVERLFSSGILKAQ
jgi:hemerythrin superfamily protein